MTSLPILLRQPALFLGALLAVIACETEPEGAGEAGAEGSLGGIGVEEDALAAQLGSANQIAAAEGQIKQEQARFLELSRQFEEKTGQKLAGIQLGEDQRALLTTMLASEKDVTTQGLLQEILDGRKHLDEIKDQISQLKQQLPTPDKVKRGDSHLGLSVKYLMNTHGLDEKKAEELARRNLLTDNLAPGMEVWHFYSDGVYGTTVTQGTAKVSPYFLNVRQFRQMKQERDDAVALAASLEAEITVLEATRDQLRRDLSSLQVAHGELQEERDVLFDEKEELVEADESVYFYVDTKRALREKELVAPGGTKLKDWRKDLFQDKLDLRKTQSLKVYAEDFGVPRIKKVQLLPMERWKEETDYQVEYVDDGRIATIHLDNVGKFKNDAFVVVLK